MADSRNPRVDTFIHHSLNRVEAFSSFVYWMRRNRSEYVTFSNTEKLQARNEIRKHVDEAHPPTAKIYRFLELDDAFEIEFVELVESPPATLHELKRALLAEFRNSEPWPATEWEGKIVVVWPGDANPV
eukprot:ANDGO_03174.mRNA.1 hypothetical protein